MHDPLRVRFWRLISGEVIVGIALADRTSALSMPRTVLPQRPIAFEFCNKT